MNIEILEQIKNNENLDEIREILSRADMNVMLLQDGKEGAKYLDFWNGGELGIQIIDSNPLYTLQDVKEIIEKY